MIRARLNDELARTDWTWGQRNNLGGMNGVTIVFTRTKQATNLLNNQYVISDFGNY